MCLVSQPKAPPPPAPPPPPPPVLDQAAPAAAVDNSQSTSLARSAKGTKAYRSGLNINSSDNSTNSGLGISQ